MKKILIVGVLLLGVFVALFRQRIFLRDPLGKVQRDGTTLDSARLYINYSNDVLVEDTAQHRSVLVQGWNGIPGVPQRLFCLTGLMCWTDADRASVFPVEGAAGRKRAEMSSKQVKFLDEAGVEVTAQLR